MNSAIDRPVADESKKEKIEMTRNNLNRILFAIFLAVCAGCANGDGGQIISGILQGIGAGLSGL